MQDGIKTNSRITRPENQLAFPVACQGMHRFVTGLLIPGKISQVLICEHNAIRHG